MTDPVVPHNLEAEAAILGAILVDDERFADVAERIGPGDFWRAAHRTIFEVMGRLVEARKPIDLLTLRAALGPEQLETVGGAGYLARLTDGVPRGSHVGAYCEDVKQAALRRRLLAIGEQAIAAARDGAIEAVRAVEGVEGALYELQGRVTPGDLVPASAVVGEAGDLLDAIAAARGRLMGVSSGFSDLDGMLRGFRPGNLILLAARPGMGKTALALNIAHAAGIKDVSTAIFSLEMSRAELMMRLLVASARVDGHVVVSGAASDRDMGRLAAAMGEVGAAPVWIDDTAGQTVSSIRAKCRRRKAKSGGLGLVVIDYLQLLSSERRYDNRVVEVGAMSRGLKQLAKELNVPILCLSQLNRAPEARDTGRPKLADLRESGSLEQDADVVLLIHRAEEYQPTPENAGVAELIIAKNRHGPAGSVHLRWCKEQVRFDSLSDRENS